MAAQRIHRVTGIVMSIPLAALKTELPRLMRDSAKKSPLLNAVTCSKLIIDN
jgi:hypothetical protein